MPSAPLDFRNTNTLWCSVIVETLVRCGVTQAVISPGSRSTPLTIAFTRHPECEALSILDERSAGFFALGLAKKSHRPVVLLCTSGTAGANYFPAVIEARESHVPLLVITADRPPELRECASGQTIDQLRLFGNHVSWFHELAAPEANIALLRYVRQTIAHAVQRAQLVGGGPVHLNAPFRDPLPPIENNSARTIEGQLSADFFSHLRMPQPADTGPLLRQRATTGRGLIIAGAENSRAPAVYADAILKLSEALGWPILADALSPVRHYKGTGTAVVVAGYDAILRSEKIARDLVPKTVLCFGGWPTSKVLRGWLESSGADVVLVSPEVENRDALHGRTRQILANAEQCVAESGDVQDPTFQALWRKAEHAAEQALQVELSGNAWTEPQVTRELAAHLQYGTPVFVASSMPIRDVEYFWPTNARGISLFFNRGANGIDGTLSTALGMAHGGRPAILLTGDLALLHDTNGFLQRPILHGSLTIVLINNHGGGIFQHLPIADFDPPFEKFFATPQEVDFKKLCAAYGVEHELVKSWEEFRSQLKDLPSAGLRVLEIQTDRKSDAAARKKIFTEVTKAVENALGKQNSA